MSNIQNNIISALNETVENGYIMVGFYNSSSFAPIYKRNEVLNKIISFISNSTYEKDDDSFVEHIIYEMKNFLVEIDSSLSRREKLIAEESNSKVYDCINIIKDFHSAYKNNPFFIEEFIKN